MRPSPDELLHFSEDPTLTVFHPHVAPTSREKEAYVWAVDEHHSPSYWFPRQCPRGMAWVGRETTAEDATRILGPGATRVHAIEYKWLAAMQSVVLYAYRFPRSKFKTINGHAWVCTEPVTALAPAVPVGDLLEAHERAGIQLRLMDRLWPWWDAVITSTVAFSGIRLRNGTEYPYGP